MQKRSMNQEEIGLGQIPPDASNELLLDPSFTKEDFEEALKKIFPLTPNIPSDEELALEPIVMDADRQKLELDITREFEVADGEATRLIDEAG